MQHTLRLHIPAAPTNVQHTLRLHIPTLHPHVCSYTTDVLHADTQLYLLHTHTSSRHKRLHTQSVYKLHGCKMHVKSTTCVCCMRWEHRHTARVVCKHTCALHIHAQTLRTHTLHGCYIHRQICL